jgi:hypothetical protein
MADEEMKLDPFTVSVNPELPATAVDGETEVIDGTGFGDEVWTGV